MLGFFTFAAYGYSLGNKCDWNIEEWVSEYLVSESDYVVLILGSIIPLIVLFGLLEFVIAILIRIFSNNNSKIKELSSKIIEDNRKLNDIENEINKITF